eukprot:5885080-Prymnesium_polylepis.2
MGSGGAGGGRTGGAAITYPTGTTSSSMSLRASPGSSSVTTVPTSPQATVYGPAPVDGAVSTSPGWHCDMSERVVGSPDRPPTHT